MLTSAQFAKARAYILSNARPLERHLFAFHFESGAASAVLAALSTYQHESGLYGHALEPDKRTANAQPVDQDIALGILSTIGAPKRYFQAVCDALDDLTTESGGLPFSHPSVMDAPHAPWWACGDPQPASINPTGHVLARLRRHGIDHPWMKTADAFCWQALDSVTSDNPHSLQNAVAFVASSPDQDRANSAISRLQGLVRDAVTFDPNAQGYVFSPLIFAPSPTSPAHAFFGPDELGPHLDHMVQAQHADGGWQINWPPISQGVEAECRAIITLRNLVTLRAYDLLEAPL